VDASRLHPRARTLLVGDAAMCAIDCSPSARERSCAQGSRHPATSLSRTNDRQNVSGDVVLISRSDQPDAREFLETLVRGSRGAHRFSCDILFHEIGARNVRSFSRCSRLSAGQMGCAYLGEADPHEMFDRQRNGKLQDESRRTGTDLASCGAFDKELVCGVRRCDQACIGPEQMERFLFSTIRMEGGIAGEDGGRGAGRRRR